MERHKKIKLRFSDCIMNKDQNKNKLSSSSNNTLLRNSNSTRETFTQWDNVFNIPLTVEAFLLEQNSVAYKIISANKLI